MSLVTNPVIHNVQSRISTRLVFNANMKPQISNSVVTEIAITQFVVEKGRYFVK